MAEPEGSVAEAGRLIDAGQTPAARQILETHLESNRNDGRAAYLLGVCYFREKRFEEAERRLLRAAALTPHDPAPVYYLGLSAERQGDPEQAATFYQRTLEIDPAYQLAKDKLGVSPSPTPPPLQPAASAAPSPSPPPSPAPVTPQRDEHLRDPGEVVYSGKRRMRSFSGHAVITALVAALAAYIWLVESGEGEAIDSAFWPAVIAAALWITLAIRSAATEYVFYERRIDFAKGVLYRKRTSMWLYQVQDVWLTRSPLNLLTGDAKVHAKAPGLEAPTRRGTKKGGQFMITGLGNHDNMRDLWAELRDAALVERRGMKNWFV